MGAELLHLTIRKNGFVVVGGELSPSIDLSDGDHGDRLRGILKDFARRHGHDVRDLEAEVRDSYRRPLFTFVV